MHSESSATVRPWDSYDAYLWDIDGTLITCTDLVHYHAFNQALSSVAGRSITIDGVVMHGNVDVGILRDAFAKHGVPEHEWRPRRQELLSAMHAYVEAARAEMQAIVLPGVRDVLTHLKEKGAVLGTATGNLEGIGRIKLERAGLLEFFDFGCYSDHCETRAEVFSGAASAARRLAGTNARLCAVGDTPADVRAARACGLDSIAVATGTYSVAQLREEHPDLLVPTLVGLPNSERS